MWAGGAAGVLGVPTPRVALHPYDRIAARLVDVPVDQVEAVGALVQAGLEVGSAVQGGGVIAQTATVAGAPLDVEDAVGGEAADGGVEPAVAAVERLRVEVDPVWEDGIVEARGGRAGRVGAVGVGHEADCAVR